ncbi:MAG: phasin family protein [Pseudomonadota bacterium]
MPKTPSPETSSPLEPEKVIQSIADLQGSGFGSLAWLGTKWMETMSDVGAEWLSFVADRVKEDVKTQHELLHAKTIGDVQKIQATFLQKAMDDYHDETGKIVEFCSNAMSEIHSKAEKKN